ncbi:MAG: carbonic anhydrase [Thiotrichales bacterium]|nr:MAG: carbonic anhydrase [Thiotrichales bacterium]
MSNIEDLTEGYRKFYKKYFVSDDKLYRELAKGQAPKTLVIACSDSRVDPAIIMNAKPGDIFSIRNVANLVPPYKSNDPGLHGVSAALEFGVCILKVENIVILGHSNCAGIKALLGGNNIEQTDFIHNWVEIALTAKNKVVSNSTQDTEQTLQHNCEQESILLSLNNLMTFPWIKEKVATGELTLHGWYFSLHNGQLHACNPGKDFFEKLSTSTGD